MSRAYRYGWATFGATMILILGTMCLITIHAVKAQSVPASQATKAIIAVVPSSIPVPPVDNPAGLIDTLATAIKLHNYKLVAVIICLLLVLFARKVGGKLLPWLATDRAGAVLALSSGVLVALLSAICAGQAVTLGLIVGGLVAGVTAAGGWNVARRLIAPPDKAAAGTPVVGDMRK